MMKKLINDNQTALKTVQKLRLKHNCTTVDILNRLVQIGFKCHLSGVVVRALHYNDIHSKSQRHVKRDKQSLVSAVKTHDKSKLAYAMNQTEHDLAADGWFVKAPYVAEHLQPTQIELDSVFSIVELNIKNNLKKLQGGKEK